MLEAVTVMLKTVPAYIYSGVGVHGMMVQGFIQNPGKGGMSPPPKNHGLES